MHADKRKKLEAKGWKLADTADFLELSPAESTLVELKVNLARTMKQLRKARHISQQKLAKLLGSSQSRVAKMEACDSSVSMDMMVRSMAVLGASSLDIAKAMEPSVVVNKRPVAKRAAAKTKAKAKSKYKTRIKTPAKKKAASGKRPVAA
jgi:transcriptional regulator with XRE-family HTH domain